MAKSVKLDADLWQRVQEYAQKAGYSSAEEFVRHVLEKELARLEVPDRKEDMERHLRGLGYLE
jgi:metal-responsive CopG/Arc/MetJ family transcriptional regulator